MFFSIAIIFLVNISMMFSQEIEEKIFNVKSYNGVEVRNSVYVTLIQDGTEKVVAKCNNRLLPAIKVEKIEGTLKIGFDWKIVDKICEKGFFNNRSIIIKDDYIKINGKKFNGGIKVIVHAKNIKKIKASSSGNVFIEGDLNSDDLYISASSSGDIKCKGLIKANKLNISGSSSGDIEAECKAKNVDVSLSSSADFEGNINSDIINFNISSSGDFEGNVNSESINVNISSSGDFEGDINAKKAIFNLSSSGEAKVKGVVEYLNVTASNSADFYGKEIVYKHAEVKTSSFANIHLSKSGEVIDKTSKKSGVFVE